MSKQLTTPSALESEIALLSTCLFNAAALSHANEHLNPDDFYETRHRVIFEVMTGLYASNTPVDEITLHAKLKDTGQLPQAGGLDYILELSNALPTAFNIREYVADVKNKAFARRFIDLTQRLSNQGFDTDTPPNQLIEHAEQQLFQLSQKYKNNQIDLIPLQSAVVQGIMGITENIKMAGQLRGVPTGFQKIDRLTSGFQGGDLVIVAARPSVGKTSWALQIGYQAAQLSGKNVLIFSLEMSVKSLTMRLFSLATGIDLNHIRNGRFNDGEIDHLLVMSKRIGELPLTFCDESEITVNKIRTQVRRFLQKHKKLDMVIIDYLQLITPKHAGIKNKNEQISEISRSLKILAREFDVPFVVLSQLSREVEKRATKIPTLSDLRDSGAIEQDADLIFLLYRTDPDANTDGQAQIPINLHLAKHRNGPTGLINLQFQQNIMAFHESDINL